MQTEKSVEVDRRIGAAALRLRNRDGWAHAIVIGFAKRHDDVQPIGRAALEEHDQLLFARHRCRGDRALKKRGHGAQPHHGHAALLQKIPPREFQPSHAFTTDRKSTRLNSSHGYISYAVFCLKKKSKIPKLAVKY